MKIDENGNEIKEAKASGGDPSESADAVSPAGGTAKGKNRKADLSKNVDPNADNIEDDVKTPKAMREDVDSIFEGHDLSEEMKTKTVAVYEARINEGVRARTDELQEQFQTDLNEQVKVAVEDIVEKLDSYLDFVAENWLEENAIAVESNFKVEVAESLLDGIKHLVTEHNMNIVEGDITIVEELETKLAEANSKYDDSIKKNMELKEENQKLELDLAFDEVSESLTDTQRDKLAELSESISYDSVDEFKTKISGIRENYFKPSTPSKTQDQSQYLEEMVQDEPVKSANPVMNRYVDLISRGSKS